MRIFSLLASERWTPFKSELFDEKTFYHQFLKDLSNAKEKVVIESPFVSSSRMERLYPYFEKIISHKVKISIVTRDPAEHDDEFMRDQSVNEILRCVEMGIDVTLLKGFHHRKLAIIDNKILWEGSLNILSFSNSLEIMRRIEGEKAVSQLETFLRNR